MDNRMNILQKALQLFYEKGYDAIGVQEIADAAGVTKPTLYHYFGSKYGLLEAVAGRICAVEGRPGSTGRICRRFADESGASDEVLFRLLQQS